MGQGTDTHTPIFGGVEGNAESTSPYAQVVKTSDAKDDGPSLKGQELTEL